MKNIRVWALLCWAQSWIRWRACASACARKQTCKKMSKNEEFKCICLCQINKWQNTSYFISMLNLTPPASMKTKFWSHTHILLIFWCCHAVTLCYCTLVIMSKVRSEPCHLIVKLAGIWQASVWGIYMLQNSPKEGEKKITVWRDMREGVLCRLGLSRWSQHFSWILSLFWCCLFFNDLCVTLIIQMFKLPGPHNASQLLRSLSRLSLYRESHRHRGQSRCKSSRFAADCTSRDD